MGHRRQRKQRRKSDQRAGEAFWAPKPGALSDEADSDYSVLLEMQRPGLAAAIAKACGNCSEFIEDQEGGRGTCLHPASGVLSPWTDTQACSYHARRR